MIPTIPAVQVRMHFRISHHVLLSGQLYHGYEAREDGSFVGSLGTQGLDSVGGFYPLIVLHGRQIKFAKIDDRLSGYDVAAFLPGGSYRMEAIGAKPVRVKIEHGKLVEVGTSIPVKEGSDSGWRRAEPDQSTLKLFPPPPNMSDTVHVSDVYWRPISTGLQLGQIIISNNVMTGYRAAIKDSGGKTYALESCVPGLEGYEVMGVQFVSSKGWFLIDAVPKKEVSNEGFTIGYGHELFWIEPVRGKR
jgi:hypothetical protein